jgi:effector-binding domain-containing protein
MKENRKVHKISKGYPNINKGAAEMFEFVRSIKIIFQTSLFLIDFYSPYRDSSFGQKKFFKTEIVKKISRQQCHKRD